MTGYMFLSFSSGCTYCFVDATTTLLEGTASLYTSSSKLWLFSSLDLAMLVCLFQILDSNLGLVFLVKILILSY